MTEQQQQQTRAAMTEQQHQAVFNVPGNMHPGTRDDCQFCPPEHSGSMENDPTGLHPAPCADWDSCPNPEHGLHPEPIPLERLQESNPGRWGTPGTGPLADVDGELGSAARQLVAALNPHPAQLAATEQIVSEIAQRIGDPESVIALRYVVETAVTRASAAPLMAPRGDQQGERVSGRAEPPLQLEFCGFHSVHPSHPFSREPGHVARCLGMDSSGPRG